MLDVKLLTAWLLDPGHNVASSGFQLFDQLLDEPGGANLLAAGLLDPGHDVAVVGLQVVSRLLKGLLIVVMKPAVGLDADVLHQHKLLHLATNLLLQPGVHVLVLKVFSRLCQPGVLHLVADLCFQLDGVGWMHGRLGDVKDILVILLQVIHNSTLSISVGYLS